MGLTSSSCIRLKISQLQPERKKKKKKKKDMYYGYLTIIALGCLVFIQVHIFMHYELEISQNGWHEGDSFEIQNM